MLFVLQPIKRKRKRWGQSRTKLLEPRRERPWRVTGVRAICKQSSQVKCVLCARARRHTTPYLGVIFYSCLERHFLVLPPCARLVLPSQWQAFSIAELLLVKIMRISCSSTKTCGHTTLQTKYFCEPLNLQGLVLHGYIANCTRRFK